MRSPCPASNLVPVTIQGKRIYALIEQLTTVDRERRIRPENYLGRLTPDELILIPDGECSFELELHEDRRMGLAD